MSAIAQRNLAIETTVARSARPNGTRQIAGEQSDGKRVAEADGVLATKVSVFVAADNRLLRETLARMLMKKGNIEVTGLESGIPMQVEAVAKTDADVLLLASRGTLNDDLLMIQEVRVSAPGIRILLPGMAKNEAEFLQCVRAGIRGYLLHDASSDEVLEGVRAVHAGEAVCPGAMCTALFRYFESEAASLPCVSARRRLGLTRREQQLLPPIGNGLTNKEIANHFSLSEQTVKNHLHRMKRKTGAQDRLILYSSTVSKDFLSRTHCWRTLAGCRRG